MAALGEQIRLALRSDVSSAVGYSEMILEDEDDLGEDTISHLERIRSSAMRMTDPINDIVAFGADSEGPIEGDEDASTQTDMVKDLVATLRDLDASRPLSGRSPAVSSS